MSPYQEALPPPATCKRDLVRTRGLFRWESVEGLRIEITLECTAGPYSESNSADGRQGREDTEEGRATLETEIAPRQPQSAGVAAGRRELHEARPCCPGTSAAPSTFHFQISSLQKVEDSVPHISSHRIVVTCLRLPRGTVTPAEAWALAVSLLTALIKEK